MKFSNIVKDELKIDMFNVISTLTLSYQGLTE